MRYNGPSKMGTGSELTGMNATRNSGHEVPVPFFQRSVNLFLKSLRDMSQFDSRLGHRVVVPCGGHCLPVFLRSRQRITKEH